MTEQHSERAPGQGRPIANFQQQMPQTCSIGIDLQVFFLLLAPTFVNIVFLFAFARGFR
jgi:hypothetical protein